VNDNRVTDSLHILVDLGTRLEELTADLDSIYRPVILYLTERNLPGTDHLCERLQTAAAALEPLHEIVSGMTYAGPDEGAFLYWEFEVKDGRSEEEAIAAMHQAFSGQELADNLSLYRKWKIKLPTLPEIKEPTLRIHPSDSDGNKRS
jgi:hypothetical protein